MDHRAEVRAFLKARRARIAPDTVGLPAGDKRRVPGLRREEVALLAGVSVDYYIRIERGDLRGASDDVLMAIARALQMNEEEVEHLSELRDLRASRLAPVASPAVRRDRTPGHPAGPGRDDRRRRLGQQRPHGPARGQPPRVRHPRAAVRPAAASCCTRRGRSTRCCPRTRSLPAHPPVVDGTLIFCGTVPAIGGIRPAATFSYELADPVRGRAIRARYGLRQPRQLRVEHLTPGTRALVCAAIRPPR